MRYCTVSDSKRLETITWLAKHLETTLVVSNTQLKHLDERAFGELNNFYNEKQITYKQWRDIYTNHGWIEEPEYKCCYNPSDSKQQRDVTVRNQEIKGREVFAFASYQKDMLYKDSYEVWSSYLTRWQLKYSLIESAQFYLNLLTSLSHITIEEALFALLGINPNVLSEPGFQDWRLYDLKAPEVKKITYQDNTGREWTTDTGTTNFFEEKLANTQEYKLLLREFNQDKIHTQDFTDWATNANLLKIVITHSSTKRPRESTEQLQNTIDNIARGIMKKHPTTKKYILAETVSADLLQDYQINRSSETIRTKKLKKFPDF